MHTPMKIRRRSVLGAAAALVVGPTGHANAQSRYPERPVRIVIPLPAGGAADVSMRAIGKELEKALGQSIVIENKPGGLFQIGVQTIASAPADGHSLLYMYSGMVSTQAIQKQFDLARQFDPVIALSESPTVLAVSGTSRFKSVRELVDFGRANPDKLTYSTLGAGSLEHLKSYELISTAGFSAVPVPYKGGPDAVKALIGGEVDFIITPVFFAQQFMPSGRMRVLAAMDDRRLAALPAIPTIIEAGVKVPPFRFWTGLLARAGTPAPIVQRLHKEIHAVMTMPSVTEVYTASGGVYYQSNNPEELRERIRSEAQSMGELARSLKLQIN
jgi:tripartite-type tricarboxylate transporter receptor subunit TctC